jgi:hypothetical protein
VTGPEFDAADAGGPTLSAARQATRATGTLFRTGTDFDDRRFDTLQYVRALPGGRQGASGALRTFWTVPLVMLDSGVGTR